VVGQSAAPVPLNRIDRPGTAEESWDAWASAYLATGGFRPLRTAEDHAMLAAATQAGCPVVHAGDIPVETSGRRLARAPGIQQPAADPG
jgi:hypothetical protein